MKRILEFLKILSRNQPCRMPQESIGKVLSRQTSMHKNTNMNSSLFSEGQHRWKTSWIDDAIKQLGEIDEEIAEEGYPSINDNTKKRPGKYWMY